jgi:hypothetical protein
MLTAFGPIIFLLGTGPKEIIHKEKRTILYLQRHFWSVIYDREN